MPLDGWRCKRRGDVEAGSDERKWMKADLSYTSALPRIELKQQVAKRTNNFRFRKCVLAVVALETAKTSRLLLFYLKTAAMFTRSGALCVCVFRWYSPEYHNLTVCSSKTLQSANFPLSGAYSPRLFGVTLHFLKCAHGFVYMLKFCG